MKAKIFLLLSGLFFVAPVSAFTIQKINNKSQSDAYIITGDYAKGKTDTAGQFKMAPLYKTEGPTYIIANSYHPRISDFAGPLPINPQYKQITVVTTKGWDRYPIEKNIDELTITEDGSVVIK